MGERINVEADEEAKTIPKVNGPNNLGHEGAPYATVLVD